MQLPTMDRPLSTATRDLAALADKLCAQARRWSSVFFPGTAHLDAGQVAVPDVVEWIADRFAGRAPPTTCE